ncbi:MAG: beta strand repeat-containing protein, partial [Bacteroidales bacterium]
LDTDSIITALGKAQGQINAFSGSSGAPLSVGEPTNGLSLTGQILTLESATTNNPGALTAADWNTFNNKVTSISASTPISISAGVTPNITLGTVATDKGGTGLISYTAGDMLYYSNGPSLSKISGALAANKVLLSGNPPTWGQVDLSTDITGALPVSAITGTMAAINGGTGISNYSLGDLLYASSGTALSKLPDVATGNSLISGGITAAPIWGKIGLTTHVSGILPVANGGTNNSTIASNGAISYSDGAKYNFSAVGTLGQALISGGSGAPTWFAPTTGSILFAGASGVLSENNSGLYWNNASGSLGIGTTSPVSALSVGTLSPFQVNSSGNIVKINNVLTSWPSSQATGISVLTNDGSGSLTWANGSNSYIQNQSLSTQTGTFNINGNGIFNGGDVGIGLGASLPTANLDVSALNNVRFRDLVATGNLDALVVDANGVVSKRSTGFVTAVTASSPFTSSGGNTPNISLTGTITVTNGGTGITNYAAGDMTYYSSGASLSKISGAYTANNVLLSGNPPVWGKVDMTTDITGTLPVSKGGTNAVTLTGYVKGNGGTNPFTAAATVPAGEISGTLAIANGGTNNAAIGSGGTIVYSNGTQHVF